MKTVLFVCVHNAGRSQMAEAFFNHMVKAEQSIGAISAGTLGAGSLNPMAVGVMAEVGISLKDQKAMQLNAAMVEQATMIVSMGCGVDAEACPARFLVTEDWGIDDPAGLPIEEVRQIRDQIKAKVEHLLARIG